MRGPRGSGVILASSWVISSSSSLMWWASEDSDTFVAEVCHWIS